MAKKPKAVGNQNIITLWPTILLAKRYAHYQKVNPSLLELFYQHRDREQGKPQQAYASSDDLLSKYPLHDELNELAEFISQGIIEVASVANEGLWRSGEKVRFNITGLWFQISNNHAFHEIHVHGNCSWSGVSYVRSGDCSKSPDSHRGEQPNGITRFYGPHIKHMPFPYNGAEDRVIVSFHAQVYDSSGSQNYDYGFNN